MIIRELTIKEKIEALESIKDVFPVSEFDLAKKTIDTAAEALEIIDSYGGYDAVREACEKSRAVQPVIHQEYGIFPYAKCPECGAYLGYVDHASDNLFCPRCGKKMDWPEDATK